MALRIFNRDDVLVPQAVHVVDINCISTMTNEGIHAFSHPACNVVKNEKSLIVIGDDIVFFNVISDTAKIR